MKKSVELLNILCKQTAVSHLGIEFIEAGNDYIIASMPVDERTIQPFGLLHGGVIMALAETVGSGGSVFLVDTDKFNVVGMHITGNHISSASSGKVMAYGKIIHRGTRTHVWQIDIKTTDGRLISACSITNMIIPK